MDQRPRTSLGHLSQWLERRPTDARADGDLLREFLTLRDEEAFATLVRRHGPLVLGACRRVLGPAEAEDAFQITFLALASQAKTLAGQPSVVGWLYRVAHRVALRTRARADRRRAVEREAHPDPGPDATAETDDREMGRVLGEELAGLPDDLRAPLVLCGLEGKTNQEAARTLGWPTGSISKKLARAREVLRQRLARRGYALAPLAPLASFGAPTSLEPVAASLVTATANAALALRAGLTSAEQLSPGAGRLLREVSREMAWVGLRAKGACLLAVLVLAATAASFYAAGPAKSVDPEPPPPTLEAPAAAKTPPEAARDKLPEGAVARMGSLLFRHPAPITASALSADGKMLASCGKDSRIILWDAATGKELRQWTTPEHIPSTLAFSPDGKTLAVGGQELLRFWDAATGEPRGPSFKEEPSAYQIAFSPDGTLLAGAGGDDGVVRVWEMATGKEVHSLGGHRGWAGSVAFAPDGRTLATAGGDLFQKDGAIRLWDVGTGKEIRRYRGHTDSVTALAFSPDGKVLASAGGDNLRFWDAASAEELRHTDGLGAGARMLAFSPDGATVLSAEDGAVRLWDAAWARESRRLTWPAGAGKDGAAAAAFFPDGKRLASAHEGGLLRLWDAGTGEELHPASGHRGPIRKLAASPDGKWLVSADESSTVHVWDVANRKEARQLTLPSGAALCLAISATGRLAVGVTAGQVVCWDLATGKPVGAHSTHDWPVTALAFDRTGKRLAIATSAGNWWMLLDENRPANQIFDRSRDDGPASRGGAAGSDFLTFSPDGALIAHGSARYGLLYFPVNSRKTVLETWPVDRSAVQLVALSPVGRNAVVRHGGKLAVWEVELWSAEPAAKPAVDRGEPAPAEKLPHPRLQRFLLPDAVAAAFSGDGRLLAVGDERGNVALWNAFTGKEIWRVEGHAGPVAALHFLPDGRSFATGGADGSILLWDCSRALPAAGADGGDANLSALWADLTNADASRAFKAAAEFIRTPTRAARFLQERLTVEAPAAKAVQEQIAALDSDEFADREKATEFLRTAGEFAEPALEKARTQQPSLEAQRRIESLLRLRTEGRPGEVRRFARAFEILEQVAGPTAARRTVEALAQGPPELTRTQSARAVLRHMGAETDGR